ncbi:MAG: transaldolase [Candidatus Sulfotelmatobacter sp.]
MKSVSELRVQVFADGADKASMLELYRQPYIKGFTTNPTLMRKAGVTDYERFAREILQQIPDRPISFEVFADDEGQMERQARRIARWAANVYVKIPVTNTRREPMYELVRRLSAEGIQVNATAVLALDQVGHLARALRGGAPSYISVFAGRVADTGLDPVPLMKSALELMAPEPNSQLVWASPRELLNIFQADEIGCHIITVTSDVLKKVTLIGKDLHDYSLETVQMFHNDAAHSGYTLELTPEERLVYESTSSYFSASRIVLALSGVSSRDVAFQFLNSLSLIGDDPFHQVAQRDHSQHVAVLSHHRKMTEPMSGHDRHAFVHGLPWSYENDG